MTPTIKSQKVYIVIESVIESRCTPDQLHEYLHSQKFRGQTVINYSQGGITNAVTKEHIAISMADVDKLIKG